MEKAMPRLHNLLVAANGLFEKFSDFIESLVLFATHLHNLVVDAVP